MRNSRDGRLLNVARHRDWAYVANSLCHWLIATAAKIQAETPNVIHLSTTHLLTLIYVIRVSSRGIKALILRSLREALFYLWLTSRCNSIHHTLLLLCEKMVCRCNMIVLVHLKALDRVIAREAKLVQLFQDVLLQNLHIVAATR
jgi:hypothetical protein